jgi:hypothetical protein
MQINIDDDEQFLRLFRLIEKSLVDSEDHETRMLYSTMKHEIDKRRDTAQTAIYRAEKRIEELNTQIDVERLNIIELQAQRDTWTIKEQNDTDPR